MSHRHLLGIVLLILGTALAARGDSVPRRGFANPQQVDLELRAVFDRAAAWLAAIDGKPLSLEHADDLLPVVDGHRLANPELADLVGWEEGQGDSPARARYKTQQLTDVANRAATDPAAYRAIDVYLKALRSHGLTPDIAARWTLGYERNDAIAAGHRGRGNVGGWTALERAHLMRLITRLLIVFSGN